MYQCDHCGRKFEQAPKGGRPSGSHLFKCPACGKITFLASGLVQQKDPVLIEVFSLPAFYTHWLAERLERYGEDNPWVEFRLDLSEEVKELGGPNLQLAIRYGLGHWPGVWMQKLFPQQTEVMGLYLVCRPEQRGEAELDQLIDWLAHQGRLSSY